MNDNELDEMLSQWKTPAVRPSLRERVRSAFEAEHPQQKDTRRPILRKLMDRMAVMPGAGKGLFGGAALGSVVFLLIIAQAFSQSGGLLPAPLPIPFTVKSEFLQYVDDGSPRLTNYLVSFRHEGNEISLSNEFPGDSLKTARWNVMNSTHLFLYRLFWRIHSTPERERADAARVTAGCLWPDQAATGHETILSYPTTIVQYKMVPSDHIRRTEWLAPDLDCFVLKSTTEALRDDGTFRLVTERLAISVLQR
jgi:hypothetical protein